MRDPRELIDYETAKELALSVANHESTKLERNARFAILDSRSQEHPWGWEFNAVVEPYWSNGSLCPFDRNCNITVDRFSGKVQIIDHAAIENDDIPILNLTLHDAGDDMQSVFKLLRQIKGWTAIETRAKMQTLPIVVAAGPMISIRALHELFLARGATTILTQQRASPGTTPYSGGVDE